ncbi:hypothetical protein HY374_03270 [Candidatus Berkelbacteria bacterium]|nr:hypothetical protein [Candidatus Berkelbacteria bacterium]
MTSERERHHQSVLERWLPRVILAVAVLSRLWLLYISLLPYDPIIPPGDDPAVHLQIIESLKRGTFSFGAYPPGYHALILGLSLISGVAPLTVMALTAPILVIGVTIAAYLLGSRWFSRTAGLIAAVLVALVGTSPTLAFVDGNYPNLLAAGFLMPLGFLFLLAGLRTNPVRNSLIASLCFAAVAAIHHLTYGMLFAIVLFFLVTLGMLEHTRTISLPHRRTVTWITLAGLGLTLFLAFAVAGPYVLLPALRDLAAGTTPTLFSDALKVPLTVNQYPEILGYFIWVGGLIGVAWVASRQTIPWERRLFLVVWMGMIFLLSRTPYSGLPARFARELTLPLALGAGALLAWLVQSAPSRLNRLILTGAVAVTLVSSTVMLASGPAQLPNGFDAMVWFSAQDVTKLQALRELPQGTRILATPSSRYYEALLPNYTYAVLPAEVAADHEAATAAIDTGADYLFISGLPNDNANLAKTYPYFAHHDEIKAALDRYPDIAILKTFPDGSQIKQVHPPRPAPSDE